MVVANPKNPLGLNSKRLQILQRCFTRSRANFEQVSQGELSSLAEALGLEVHKLGKTLRFELPPTETHGRRVFHVNHRVSPQQPVHPKGLTDFGNFLVEVGLINESHAAAYELKFVRVSGQDAGHDRVNKSDMIRAIPGAYTLDPDLIVKLAEPEFCERLVRRLGKMIHAMIYNDNNELDDISLTVWEREGSDGEPVFEMEDFALLHRMFEMEAAMHKADANRPMVKSPWDIFARPFAETVSVEQVNALVCNRQDLILGSVERLHERCERLIRGFMMLIQGRTPAEVNQYWVNQNEVRKMIEKRRLTAGSSRVTIGELTEKMGQASLHPPSSLEGTPLDFSLGQNGSLLLDPAFIDKPLPENAEACLPHQAPPHSARAIVANNNGQENIEKDQCKDEPRAPSISQGADPQKNTKPPLENPSMEKPDTSTPAVPAAERPNTENNKRAAQEILSVVSLLKKAADSLDENETLRKQNAELRKLLAGRSALEDRIAILEKAKKELEDTLNSLSKDVREREGMIADTVKILDACLTPAAQSSMCKEYRVNLTAARKIAAAERGRS